MRVALVVGEEAGLPQDDPAVALAIGDHAIPLFWVTLFADADLVAIGSPPGPVTVLAVADRAEAVERSQARLAHLRRAWPETFESLASVWLADLAAMDDPVIAVQYVGPIVEKHGPVAAGAELRAALDAIDAPGSRALVELLRANGFRPATRRRRSLARTVDPTTSACGRALYRPVPWAHPIAMAAPGGAARPLDRGRELDGAPVTEVQQLEPLWMHPPVLPPADPGQTRRWFAYALAALVLFIAVAVAAVGRDRIEIGSPSAAPTPPKTYRLAPSAADDERALAATLGTLGSTSSTTSVPVELLALRGRPASPVALDDAVCAGGLRSGSLEPSDWTPWNPAPEPATAEVTEDQVVHELTAVLRNRFRASDPDRAVADGMALYNSPKIRAETGDQPVLRAAVAEMKGTIAEPAVTFLLTTPLDVVVAFGSVDGDGDESALWWSNAVHLTLADRMQHEHPAIVAPSIFYGLVAQFGSALDQSIISGALAARFSIEQIRDDPALLAPSTTDSRGLRWKVLAQLESRAGGVLSVSRSDSGSLFPPGVDGANAANYAALFRDPKWAGAVARPDVELAGNSVLTGALTALSPDSPQDPPPGFGAATIAIVDAHPGVTSCDQAVAAQALGVLPGGAASAAAADYLRSVQT